MALGEGEEDEGQGGWEYLRRQGAGVPRGCCSKRGVVG